MAHIILDPQSLLSPQEFRVLQALNPLTQYPAPSVVLAQTPGEPGPQGVEKVSQIWPVQLLLVQAPLAQTPVVHYIAY